MWLARVIAKQAAQSGDASSKGVVGYRAVVPDRVENLVLLDEFSVVLEQKEQHAICLGFNGHGFACPEQKELPFPDLKLPKPENKGFVIRHNSVTRFQKSVWAPSRQC